MRYIPFGGSGGEVLVITNKLFRHQPSYVWNSVFLQSKSKSTRDISQTLQRTKVFPVRWNNCICNKWQRLRSATRLSANPGQITDISTDALNYNHTCTRLCKALSFILRFLAALVVQRRFQISPRMIFTGVKATIPHDCKPSLLEQTPAPIFLCVKTIRGIFWEN